MVGEGQGGGGECHALGGGNAIIDVVVAAEENGQRTVAGMEKSASSGARHTSYARSNASKATNDRSNESNASNSSQSRATSAQGRGEGNGGGGRERGGGGGGGGGGGRREGCRKEAERHCHLDEGGAEAVGAHAAHATSYASIRQDTSEGGVEAVGAHATDEPKTKWRCSNKQIHK